MSRSSRPEVFFEKGALRNFAKFTGKHLCQSFFFNKVSFSYTVNKDLHGDTVVFKNKCSEKFCKFQWTAPVLQAGGPLLKRGSNKSALEQI